MKVYNISDSDGLELEFPNLHGFYEGTFRETKNDKEIRKYVEYIDDFYFRWSGLFIHAVEHDIRKYFPIKDNIILKYLSTQTMVFDFIGFALFCGNYSLVYRELRTILESVILAYKIEFIPGLKTLYDKLGYWENLELKGKSYGKKVFSTSGLPNWGYYYDLYIRFCKYTHSSTQITGLEMIEVIGQSKEFEYNRTKFVKCVLHWIEVAQISSEIMLEYYERRNIQPDCFSKDIFKLSV